MWGVRLAVYLLYDRVFGRPEDARYAELRKHGETANTWFFWFPNYFFESLMWVAYVTFASDRHLDGLPSSVRWQ